MPTPPPSEPTPPPPLTEGQAPRARAACGAGAEPDAAFARRLEALSRTLGAERVVRTHAAVVLLAGDRAWKLKRPVALGYLDFSTPERRRAALAAELCLNRRTAPGLYLALRGIDREGRITDDPSAAADWVLEMRRFPDDALLAARAARGPLAEPIVLGLADRIAAFLDRAPVVRGGPGGAERMASVIAGNRASSDRFPEILPSAEVAALHAAQEAELGRLAPLLDARAAAGRVRRGHGDLHLANIALVDGEPVPFDCLEFSDALATCDTLYDLAFLLMDLWRVGQGRAAAMLLNRVLDRAPEDEAGFPLLPLFLSVRAHVRAHVAAAAGAAGEARAFLALARRLLGRPGARLVAIGGLSGSGKSRAALAIADLGGPPGARIVRSDVVRKHLAGVALEERLLARHYRPEFHARTMAELARRCRALLAEGFVAIADAVHARAEDRAAAEALAAGLGAPFTGLWLDAPTALRLARVEARVGDASDADRAVVLRQGSIALGDLSGWHRIDASGPPEAVAAAMRAAVGLVPAGGQDAANVQPAGEPGPPAA